LPAGEGWGHKKKKRREKKKRSPQSSTKETERGVGKSALSIIQKGAALSRKKNILGKSERRRKAHSLHSTEKGDRFQTRMEETKTE